MLLIPNPTEQQFSSGLIKIDPSVVSELPKVIVSLKETKRRLISGPEP